MVMSKALFVKSVIGLAIAIPLFVACGHDSSAKNHSVSPIYRGPVPAVPYTSPGWRQQAPDTANGYSWSNQRGAGSDLSGVQDPGGIVGVPEQPKYDADLGQIHSMLHSGA